MKSWTASSTRAARCRLEASTSGTWASAFDPCGTYEPCHTAADPRGLIPGSPTTAVVFYRRTSTAASQDPLTSGVAAGDGRGGDRRPRGDRGGALRPRLFAAGAVGAVE